MSAQLTSYFEKRLTTMGFDGDELTLYYALGHCQGDGVACYGSLSVGVVVEVCKRHNEFYALAVGSLPYLQAVKYYRDLEMMLTEYAESMRISGERGHYHHWNSMSFEIEVPNTFEDMLEEDAAESTPFLLNREPSEWDQMLEDTNLAVNEYLQTCSRILEKEGYGITGAAGPEYNSDPVIHREEWLSPDGSRRFEIQVKLLEPEFPSETPALDDMYCEDMPRTINTVKDYVAGKTRYADLEWRVVELLEDDEEYATVDTGLGPTVDFDPNRLEDLDIDDLVGEAKDALEKFIGEPVPVPMAA